ncbi:MAG: hypothetical protein AAGD35_10670 [Actinomycetota bacterium]
MDELQIDDQTRIALEINTNGQVRLRLGDLDGAHLILAGSQLDLHRAIIEADRQLSLLTHGVVG